VLLLLVPAPWRRSCFGEQRAMTPSFDSSTTPPPQMGSPHLSGVSMRE
jgi:hypothetical protein